MSTPPMYGNLTPLDREMHRKLRLDTGRSTLEKVQGLNSLFIAVVEFAEACKEFPIVFVRVGEAADGKAAPVAPLAVMGLKPGSNVIIRDGKWSANYTPAYLRRYPFAMARINAENDIAVCFDSEWAGFSETEGTPLFGDDGQPTEFTLNAKEFLESFERESERTRLACEALQAADLLRDMRFEATLPSGEKIEVEGFMALNEEKYNELSDEKIVEFQRNGLLSLIEQHRISLSNMTRLAGLHQQA